MGCPGPVELTEAAVGTEGAAGVGGVVDGGVAAASVPLGWIVGAGEVEWRAAAAEAIAGMAGAC